MFKLQFKDNPNRSIWLVGEKVTLGSHADNTLVLDGLGIDEFHAVLIIEPDHLILKSKPGSCVVNDLPVDDGFRLVANDELRIGRERLLIVDPRLQKPSPAQTTGTADSTGPANWVLIPDHPSLKSLDFSIHGRAVIGRSKECQLSVPYKLLSREHAELRVDNGQLFLKDLGSANGCFVNGKRVQEAKLASGDKVAFAKLVFLVQGVEAPVAKSSRKAVGDEEMNRTMIRPAINLEAELAAQQASEESNSIQLELEPLSDDKNSATAHTASGSGAGMVVIVVVLVAAAAAAWYFLRLA